MIYWQVLGALEPPTGHSTNARALRAHLRCQRDLGLRLHGAHLDEQPAAHVLRKKAGRAVVDRIHGGASVRMVMTTSDFRASSAGVAAAAAPAAASGFSLAAERFTL